MLNQMRIGGRYNWKGQLERLIYMGKNWSGNGYWHQFSLVGSPDEVWCEVKDSDLDSFEMTREEISLPMIPALDRGLNKHSKLSPRQQRKARKAANRDRIKVERNV